MNPEGTIQHLRTKKPAEMRLLNGEKVEVEPGSDPRQDLADWITSDQNPYFARAAANWVWAQFFGTGHREPAR